MRKNNGSIPELKLKAVTTCKTTSFSGPLRPFRSLRLPAIQHQHQGLRSFHSAGEQDLCSTFGWGVECPAPCEGWEQPHDSKGVQKSSLKK